MECRRCKSQGTITGTRISQGTMTGTWVWTGGVPFCTVCRFGDNGQWYYIWLDKYYLAVDSLNKDTLVWYPNRGSGAGHSWADATIKEAFAPEFDNKRLLEAALLVSAQDAECRRCKKNGTILPAGPQSHGKYCTACYLNDNGSWYSFDIAGLTIQVFTDTSRSIIYGDSITELHNIILPPDFNDTDYIEKLLLLQ